MIVFLSLLYTGNRSVSASRLGEQLWRRLPTCFSRRRTQCSSSRRWILKQIIIWWLLASQHHITNDYWYHSFTQKFPWLAELWSGDQLATAEDLGEAGGGLRKGAGGGEQGGGVVGGKGCTIWGGEGWKTRGKPGVIRVTLEEEPMGDIEYCCEMSAWNFVLPQFVEMELGPTSPPVLEEILLVTNPGLHWIRTCNVALNVNQWIMSFSDYQPTSNVDVWFLDSFWLQHEFLLRKEGLKFLALIGISVQYSVCWHALHPIGTLFYVELWRQVSIIFNDMNWSRDCVYVCDHLKRQWHDWSMVIVDYKTRIRNVI